MVDVVAIDSDLPSVRALVRFRNSEQPCLIIRQDKARSDARVFREIASLLGGSDRSRELAEWLNDLTAKYERMES